MFNVLHLYSTFSYFMLYSLHLCFTIVFYVSRSCSMIHVYILYSLWIMGIITSSTCVQSSSIQHGDRSELK